MTVRRLSFLQWVGLLAGIVALALGHLFGIALAGCGSARWAAVPPAIAAFVMLLAAAASALVIARTQSLSYEDDPPLSRIRFFAIAALVANVLFTLVMMLDLVGNVFNAVCRQS